jgi:hypothetical protein
MEAIIIGGQSLFAMFNLSHFSMGGSKLYAQLNVGVDISYVAPQAHGIVSVALHQEHSLGILFIFSQGRKDLYHV